ncbi:enoyl-CoA hydratase/isomerase family protein [Leucobacter viscericola]|uniref:3-hydroxyisobutyryl-CoA hydrolase n=1 Tax=Leucobacter viscericola TaxID=2714935 RepID=A0A6G7XCF5_9MICO|nr:3-hydroxyisobutyryl-CoA hydrolase [Leucobacter viscericola]QIK62290.1 enoyl-CoA hydratase/isomerase family protein [Leucobacter viscericola]
MSTDALVLVRREGAISHITLNRPRAINALNLEMFEALTVAVAPEAVGDATAILLDGAGERGFCGGGDVKEIVSGDSFKILSTEYRLDYAIAQSAVPVVAIMDGIAMGGGIGLGGHAAHRIVTERSRLALPEVRIGIVPDVGGHLLLAHAPGRLGELLAITAGELTAGDAIALGFADHFVPSNKLEALRVALSEGVDPAAAIAEVAETAPESGLLAARGWWDPIAEGALEGAEASAEAALDATIRLLRVLEADGGAEATQLLETVRGMCPTSVVVTLAQVARTRALGLDLAEVLEDDLRVVVRIGQCPDFAEGVRAQVIDKDRSPKWQPSRIEDLDPAEVAAILAPHHPDEGKLGLAP